MNYTPHTPQEIQEMLRAVGAQHLDDLFGDIPAEILDPPLGLDAPLSEVEFSRHIRQLAAQNQSAALSFLGGGIRAHHVPAAVPVLAARAEFLSAYTPYQPEASQGLLQAIFEYQTMISELTGLPVSNASMYDGSTALAEGVLLALRETGRLHAAVLASVHPEYRRVLQTYLDAIGGQLTVLQDASQPLPDGVGAVVAQNPDFLGTVHILDGLAQATHQAGGLLVVVADLLSLAVLRPPGAYGADVAVGEGQPLGNAMAFGGPHFGYLAVQTPLLRQLPGRLVSQTTDLEGRRAFILTLQAREQYIRRSKAKSNITTNAQLTALMGAVYLAGMGPQGLREVAVRSVAMAQQLAGRLEQIPGIKVVSPRPFFNEFAVELPRDPHQVRLALAQRGLAALVPLPAEYGSHRALLACTEQHTPQDLETLALALQEVLQ